MQQIKQSGLRYGDHCSIISHVRPKKSICLNRTQWEILPEGDRQKLNAPAITIPGAKAGAFRWKLELVNVQDEQRFLLRSLDESFFILNGQYGREAFIESSDILAADQLWGRLEFNRHSSGVDVKPPGWPGPLLNEKILQSSLPVILQGETGTGKSHLAEEIHKRSGRQGQFVSLNLASLSSGLIESELFGHQRGSFTGAIRDHRGAFALARGGTIFLDEIDSISRDIQVKLLTFLDHGYFRPIGAERSERSDARVIVASGQKLVDLVRKELFRKDLFYRLSQGVLCQLLPLRDQPELIKRHCLIFSLEKNVIISERLIDFYKTLPWPGNVRQLRGHLDLKAIKSRTKKIDFDDSDDALLAMSSDLTFFQEFASVKPMEEMKRDYAQRVYLMLNQNLVRTAKELKVNVKTLKNWISEKECG